MAVRVDSVVLQGVDNVAEPMTELGLRWSWKFCSSGIRGRTCSQQYLQSYYEQVYDNARTSVVNNYDVICMLTMARL
jgi:hypothetical protein